MKYIQEYLKRNFGSILADTVGGFVLGGPVGAIAGAATGIGTDALQNQQMNNQAALGQQQVANQEQLMQYNEQQQLQYWKDTGAPNQVRQLEAAGLNPALMYAKGGTGGMTMPGAPSASMGIPPQASGAQNMATTAQLAETAADVKLKNAQAENISAQTPQEAPLMQANIDNLAAGTQNKQAETTLNDIKSQTQRLLNSITGETIDDQIAQIKSTASTIEQTAQQAVRNNWMDQQTMNDKLSIVHGTMIGTFLQNAQTQAQTTNTKQNTQNSIQQVAQAWAGLKINQQNANTQESQMKIQQFVQDQSQGNKTIIDSLTKIISSLIIAL